MRGSIFQVRGGTRHARASSMSSRWPEKTSRLLRFQLPPPPKRRLNFPGRRRPATCWGEEFAEPMARKSEPTFTLPTTAPKVMPGKSHWRSGTEKNIPPPSTTESTPITNPPAANVRGTDPARKLRDDSSTVVFYLPADDRVHRFPRELLPDESGIPAF